MSPQTKSSQESGSKPVSSSDSQFRENRRRASLRSRSRSRSRSFDKQIRSRSRDRRIAEREKTSRQYRNKSPPGDRRRYDRRGGDNRSPKSFGGARGGPLTHSLSKSRSRSPERRKLSRSISPLGDDILPKGKRQRCRDFDGKYLNVPI